MDWGGGVRAGYVVIAEARVGDSRTKWSQVLRATSTFVPPLEVVLPSYVGVWFLSKFA